MLFHKLNKLGVKGKMFKAIRSLYNNITAVAAANGTDSTPFKLEIGTAQGCPLSPTLFAIFINDLVLKLENDKRAIKECPVLAYADDIVVMAENAKDIQELVNICYKWTANFRMAANVKKSAIMRIDKKRNKITTPVEKIFWGTDQDKTPLPIVDEYKYLGLIIDKSMSFQAHAEKKLAKVKQKCGMISSFCRNPSTPHSMKKQLITAFALAGITYGIQFFGWDQEEKTIMADATAARLLTGTNNQTNKEAIIQLAGLTPLLTTASIRGKKQINKIQELKDERLSKITLLNCQDNTSLHYRTRATPDTKSEITAMCQEMRQEVVDRLREGQMNNPERPCTHLEVGPWGSPKEAEGCSTRCLVRIGQDAFCKHAKEIGPERAACCPLCPSPDNIRPEERTPAAPHHCYTDCPNTRRELEELIKTINFFESPKYRTKKILEEHLKLANTSKTTLMTQDNQEELPITELIGKFVGTQPIQNNNNMHREHDENSIFAQQFRMQQNFVRRYVVQNEDIQDKDMLNGRRRSKRIRNKRRARAAGEGEHDLNSLRNNKPKLLTKLLNPNYWSKDSNYAINKWITKINNKVRKHIIAMSQPSLAELINPNDSIPLNDNIVGQVFVIHFKQREGFWKKFKGKRRIKVIDYHHRSNSFTVDTTRLDVCELNHEWYSFEIELNQELRIGSLTHIPKQEVVELPRDIDKVSKGMYFDSNVIGRSLNLMLDGNDYVTYQITSYDQDSDQHVVKSGERGTRQVSLNKLYYNDKIDPRTISFFEEALCHAKRTAPPPSPFPPPPKVPHGIPSSGSAARPMPRGLGN